MQGDAVIFEIKDHDEKRFEVCEAALLHTLGVIDSMDASDANRLWKSRKSVLFGRSTDVSRMPKSDMKGFLTRTLN